MDSFGCFFCGCVVTVYGNIICIMEKIKKSIKKRKE